MNYKEPTYCHHCGSKKFIKTGKTKTPLNTHWKQKYKCKKCNHKFTGKTKHPIDLLPGEQTPFTYQPKPLKKTSWPEYNQSQQNEKRMFLEITKELLDLIQFENKKPNGRPPQQINDMIFCMMLKTYTKLSSRRLASDLQTAKRQGYINHVPCFSTLMRYFNDQRLTRLLKELVHVSATPVAKLEKHYSIDSSGFSTSKFGRWMGYRFKNEIERRIYRKAHIMIGVRTNIVTSVEITNQYGADSPQLKHLVKKTALNFQIKELSCDKAYSSRFNHETIHGIGGKAYIPFRSNATGSSRGSLLWKKMLTFFQENPQAFFRKYHARSNIETSFFMIKQKFGAHLMTKNYDSNVNEILCKVLAHNVCCLIAAYFEFKIESRFSTKTPEKVAVGLMY